MNLELLLAGSAAVFLFLYLGYSIIRPEKF
jgi:K+-transporting ATPase KdpF subunit